MNDILTRIVAAKKKWVAEQQDSYPISELERVLDKSDKRFIRDRFAGRLRADVERRGMAVIAECKQASPSAGKICLDYDPVEVAEGYERAGASCLSVLTEEEHFQGHDQDLELVATFCDTPVLCKDFIVDEWQILSARLLGADCVLLIAALLPAAELTRLTQKAQECGLDTLTEVHEESELERALMSPETIIGINNRNLRDLSVDVRTSTRLRAHIPPGRLVVSESGIADAQTILMLREHGLSVFLIGEHLMRQPNPGRALAGLLAQVEQAGQTKA